MSSVSFPIGAIELHLMPKIDLDPMLLSYWENFPCPPPWSRDLLYKVNWTNCYVPQEVGFQIRDLMVERCSTYTNVNVIAREVGTSHLFQTCSFQCKVIISAVCLFVGLLILTGVFVCLKRKRLRKSDFSPTHETALNSGNDRKYYTSCIRGSPVIKNRNKKDSGMDIMLLERENFQNLYTEPEALTAEQQIVDQEYHDILNQQLIKLAQMAENRFTDSLKKQKRESKISDGSAGPSRSSSRDVIARVISGDKIRISVSSERIKSCDSNFFKTDIQNVEGATANNSLCVHNSSNLDCQPSTSGTSIYHEDSLSRLFKDRIYESIEDLPSISYNTKSQMLEDSSMFDNLSDDMITFKHSSSDDLDPQCSNI